MTIEQHIRKSLRGYAQTMDIPAELDAKVAQGLKKRGRVGRRVLKRFRRIFVVALIGVFAVTAAAVAASPDFADSVYGSFAELKKKVATVSIQEYQRVGMKFAGAEKELGDDYPAFVKLSRQVVAAKVEYASHHWQIDFSALPPEKYSELKQLYADIQPYFDRLSHLPVARDVLTSEEYEAYITAQLQRETIMAKGGVNPNAGPVQLNDLPAEWQPGYKKALQTIEKYERKINQSSASK